jgi:hypothetical protein
MKHKLNIKDYKTILEFYDINKSKNIKEEAEKILATKLCRCIKKVKKKEPESIAICRKSIFINRGFDFSKFSCKKGYKLMPNKTSKYRLYKKKKGIRMRKTKKRRRRK